MFNYLYYIIFAVLSLAALYLFIRVFFQSVPANRTAVFSISRFRNIAMKGNLISFGRIKVAEKFYNVVRFTILALWLVLIIILKLFDKTNLFGIQILLIFATFILSMPREKIGRLKLPYFYISEYIKNATAEKYNREIFWTISLLINLFTIKGDEKIGSNYIFDQIIKTVDVTKPIYIKMLSMWNMNLKKEATDYFAKEIGTKEARDLASVFIKLDSLDVKHFKNQLINYQNSIKNERTTLRERVNERNGMIIYSLAIFSSLFVLVNFILFMLSDVFLTYNTLPI